MSSDIKIKVQSFGRFLSNMVMPNIGAFIAWGIITALFIPTGWLPNETLAKLVGPMITYLLPLLIGYTGGRLVGGDRGGVVIEPMLTDQWYVRADVLAKPAVELGLGVIGFFLSRHWVYKH